MPSHHWASAALGKHRVSRAAAFPHRGIAPLAACLLTYMLACAPAARRPDPSLPPPTAPPTTTPQPRPPAPAASRAFRYTPGEHRYLLTTDATLSLQADSVRPPLESHTTTRILYTLSVDTSTQPLHVSGSIDSFTVQRGSRIPTPVDSSLQLPLRWSSTSSSPDASGCSIASELIASAQELLPRLPDNLPDGHHWKEETSRSICRAELPVTVSTVHQYQVTGRVVLEGDTLLRITRSTSATLAGERLEGDRPITLVGSASGSAELFISLGLGRLVARTEQSQTEMAIETPRGTTRLTQELRSQLRARMGQ
jgi:hypothetical protein